MRSLFYLIKSQDNQRYYFNYQILTRKLSGFHILSPLNAATNVGRLLSRPIARYLPALCTSVNTQFLNSLSRHLARGS